MKKAFSIFLKFIKYTFLTCLILIVLAAAGIYFFQDKIIELTFNELNKHLVTKIEIDKNVNLSIFDKFPQISIGLHNVRVYENVPQSTGKLATLQNLYFTFDAYDFVQGRYVINNIYAESGDIKIKIDKKGYANYFIFKSDTTSESNISFNLQKISLEDVTVDYDNQLLDQKHNVYINSATSKVSVKEKVWYFGLKGDLLVNKIGIGGNEYFKEKTLVINSEQEYHEDSRLFKIHPSIIHVEGSEFKLAGFYEGKGKNEIDFNLKAEKSTIATLFSLLPKKINQELSVYRSSGNIFFEASLKGFISADQSPNINIDFGFNNASFYHPDYDKKIQNATLRGSFSNGERKNTSSCKLKLNDIQAVFDGRKFSGNFEIENFNDPYLKFDLAGSLDVKSLIHFYPVEKISEAIGILDVNLSFEGRPEDLKTNEGKEKITATGNINIKDLYVILKDSPIEYKNINGSFAFNKNDVTVSELSGIIGKSDFRMEGSFRNLIPKMIFDKEKMLIETKLTSEELHIDELMKLFSSPSNAPIQEDPNNPYPYLSDYTFKLDCDVKHLAYKKVHAKNLLGIVEFKQPYAAIKNGSVELAGGKIQLNSFIDFKSKDKIEVSTKALLSNVYVDSVFYLADNFSQNFLIDKNLKGQFKGDMQLFFAMNHKMKINSSSVVASIDASIINGELNNFEPMIALSTVNPYINLEKGATFFDKEELTHIKFSELKNKVNIKDGKIEIGEMEIKSNVSKANVVNLIVAKKSVSIQGMNISGIHTFDQKIDYKIAVSYKNSKNKPDKDEAFGAIEEDKNGNSKLFITIKGTTEDYDIAYDKKKAGDKIKEDLKKEKQEIQDIFKNKKPVEAENISTPDETEFFGDDFSF